MLHKSARLPQIAINQAFKRINRFTHRTQGIAILGSITLHALVAASIPLWFSSASIEGDGGFRSVVPVVKLPPEVQDRLPNKTPPIDLSVFERSPDFDLDIVALNPLPSPDSNPLPTPGVPVAGQPSFSFAPVSPPSINSSYNGFTLPPAPSNLGFLPPPPTISFAGPPSPGEANSIAPNGISVPGQQSQLTLEIQPTLIQQQRQLEDNAAIALANKPSSRSNPQFNGDLLTAATPLQNPDTENRAISAERGQNTSEIQYQDIAGNYPKGACGAQASGTAVYNVTVSPSGSITQTSLLAGAGNAALDRQAAQDVQNQSFNGNYRSHRVRLRYQYAPSFCAAFAPQPAPAPSTPSAPLASPPEVTATESTPALASPSSPPSLPPAPAEAEQTEAAPPTPAEVILEVSPVPEAPLADTNEE